VVEKDNSAKASNPDEIRQFVVVEIERKLGELAEMALLVA